MVPEANTAQNDDERSTTCNITAKLNPDAHSAGEARRLLRADSTRRRRLLCCWGAGRPHALRERPPREQFFKKIEKTERQGTNDHIPVIPKAYFPTLKISETAVQLVLMHFIMALSYFFMFSSEIKLYHTSWQLRHGEISVWWDDPICLPKTKWGT